MGARLPPRPIAAFTFGVAALVLAPALTTERVAAGPVAWALLAYLGLVPTALAYMLYVVGMRTTAVGASGVLGLIEPLTATLIGVAFFGDRLGAPGLVGAGLLLGAVAALTLRPAVRRSARRAGPGCSGRAAS